MGTPDDSAINLRPSGFAPEVGLPQRGDRTVGSAGIPFDPTRVNRLPEKPGVYLFRSAREEILYVGKAKVLRARVRSYLTKGGRSEIKTRELVRLAETVETFVVGSEAEALILEANLIKEHRPRFNIQLRDDKTYPYVKVTVNEPFPRAYVTRRLRRDGARYFGPFVSVARMRQALEAVKRIYAVRSCRYDLPGEVPARPCLDHHIGRCMAPCAELQSQRDYRSMIGEVVRILSGDVAEIQVQIEEEMRKASRDMEFERATHLRDVLFGLDAIARLQRVQVVGGGDQDVVGLARDGARAAVVTLQVRGGVLVGRYIRFLIGVDGEPDPVLLSRFASHAYLSSGSAAFEQLPREVLFPVDFDDLKLLERVLTTRASRRVFVRVPKRGAKVRLLDLAAANARHALSDRTRRGEVRWIRTDDVLYELQERLDLKGVPRLIVCFDVSHTQGSETVASAVLFENGEPKKSAYRHMRIRGKPGNDDYRSMAEAVRRYFARKLTEEGPLPDLVVIDGGRGQLRAAQKALHDLSCAGVPLAALAKRHDLVYRPEKEEALRIPATSPSLHLMQRVRDEAHRFAVGYNRKLRSRRTLRSELGDIPGVGPKRQQALLSRFGSVRGVRDATPAEIGRVPGFSEAMGVRILTWLKGGGR